MIKPTIGRVLWYFRGPEDSEMEQISAQPFRAHVDYVFGDGLVNLSVTDHQGSDFLRDRVAIVPEGADVPTDCGYAVWMPYQLGQAARTEAAEAKVKD